MPPQPPALAKGENYDTAVMDLIAGRLEEPIEELGPLKLRNMSRAPKVVAGHAYAVGPVRRSATALAPGAMPGPMIDSFQRPFADQIRGCTLWFSDGLVEDIIAALSYLDELPRGLIVISRATRM